MIAGEEEEHGYQAIIKALTKALTDIKDSPMDSLKPPTFDWNSSEQFEDFQLFIKGMESWYTLQGIPDKDGDTTRLEYHSISWVPSNEGSMSSGTPLAQLQRNERRIRRVLSSLWSSYTALWITLFLNDAGFTSWKRSGSRLARLQMNSLNESKD